MLSEWNLKFMSGAYHGIYMETYQEYVFMYSYLNITVMMFKLFVNIQANTEV